MYLSPIIRRIKLAFPVPLPSTKPKCSSDITHFLRPLNLYRRVFENNLAMRLMRLTVRYSGHFTVAVLVGKTINVDLLMSGAKYLSTQFQDRP